MSDQQNSVETQVNENSTLPGGNTEPPKTKKRRGFAAMDPTRVAEIASKGGRAAHAAGTAHEFTSDEAREAGRKGGYATHARRRASKAVDNG